MLPSPCLAGLLAALLAALAVWPSVARAVEDEASAAADAGSPAFAALTPLEQPLLELTNADRVAHGVPPVEFDAATLRVARRAVMELQLPELLHYDAGGQLAFVRLLAVSGIDYWGAGENLARAPTAGPRLSQSIEQALMRSPRHRQNILEPAFNRLAVGAAADGAGAVAIADIFRAAP